MLRSLAVLFFAALVAPLAHAATSGQRVSLSPVSVAAADSIVLRARFFDALGNPSVGETVQWGNDAIGFFPNNGFSATSTTDATGTASMTFTALSPAGITGVVTATAGVTVGFAVNTYNIGNIYFTITPNPALPRPGQPFTLSVTPMTGVYKLYGVDVGASVIAGDASASITPSTANSGQGGNVSFQVTPDGRLGTYTVVVSHHGVSQRTTFSPPANPWQDMWWAGSQENGWGMSIVQHSDGMLFSVIYAYDASGKPSWYVVPGGTWNSSHTVFTGAAFRPTGSPYTAYDASKFVPGASVGNVTLTFTSLSTATLDFTLDGVSGTKALSRQSFGTSDSTAMADYGDMYWGGTSQNGWGIAVLQQNHAFFCVWFTYDDQGKPTWFVMPSGGWADANTWQGNVYTTTGSPWLGKTYDPNALQVTQVGAFQAQFGIEGATFNYLINGRSGTLALTRQPF